MKNNQPLGVTTNLLHVRQKFLTVPTWSIERVEIVTLGASVHHEVDRGAAPQDTSCRHYALTASELLSFVRFVEVSVRARWHKMVQVEDWVLDGFDAAIVWSAFNDQHRKSRVGFCQTTSNYTSRSATWTRSVTRFVKVL